MKDKDQEIKDTIKNKMDLFNHNTELPKKLAPEAIAEKLKGENLKVRPKSNKTYVRRITAMAAALVVVVGGLTVYKLFKPNKPIVYDASVSDVKSRQEIVKLFKEMKKQEKKNQNSWGALKGDDLALPEAGVDAGRSGSEMLDEGDIAEDALFGETNVQVKGIDEPDILKNDGKYLYLASRWDGSIAIYDALPAEKMKKVAELKHEGTDVSTVQMLVKDKFLILLGQKYEYGEDKYEILDEEAERPDIHPYHYYSGKISSYCDVYDLSDMKNPKLVKSLEQDGGFITARLVEDKVYILSHHSVDIFSERLEEECLPGLKKDGVWEEFDLKEIDITNNPTPEYLVVSAVDLKNIKAEPQKKAVLGGGREAYCTSDGIFVARTVYGAEKVSGSGGDAEIMISPVNFKTEIYSFSIGDKLELKSSGIVDGEILNQFSMDKHEGYFRIATTSGSWEKSSSNIFVLNDKLETVGSVNNIAPGERIFGVRFMGEVAYMVTFEQTDPFFVIDLKDPKNPKILGELKIPGFSSYLHPINDNLVLGIGQNGDDRGTLPGVKLSLFDVSDPAKPKEKDRLVIKGETTSEAMYNHRAFLKLPDEGRFAIPINRYDKRPVFYDYEGSRAEDGEVMEEPYLGESFAFTSFESFEIKEGKIHPLVSYKEADKDNYSYGYGGIERGTFIGDFVYTVSALALTAYDMEDGRILSTVKLGDGSPYREYDVYYDYVS